MSSGDNFRRVAAIAAVLVLAGCQGMGNQPRVAARPAPGGVEGEWMSTDGVAMSRFSGGAFETLATDTGNRLADGNYRHLDANTVSITVRSLIRQTTTQVNCALVSASQLNCTSSAGQQFSLVRRPGGVS